MKILLLFPPQWNPSYPHLALPSLTAFLKREGYDVVQMDINVEAYDTLLSKPQLKVLCDKIRDKFSDLENAHVMPPTNARMYRDLGKALLSSPYILDNIENAKRVLRTEAKFFDFETYLKNTSIIEAGLSLVSAAYYPTNIRFNGFKMKYRQTSFQQIQLAINDRETNPFIELFEKYFIPSIFSEKPDLIGISISGIEQIIPGLTLASMVKQRDKEVHVTIGGNVFTRLKEEIHRDPSLFSFFDSVVINEGEHALLELAKQLSEKQCLKKVPNLLFYDGSKVIVNQKQYIEDVNSLPTPCFDGLPLDLYFSPKIILPLLTSRGCYWRQCAFCDHGFGYPSGYRARDLDLVTEDLRLLSKRYFTDCFAFSDESVSLKRMSLLSQKILERDIKLSWYAYSRMEREATPQLFQTIANAGCKMLLWGMESGCDRILKHMNKGINTETIKASSKMADDAGIWNHIFILFGFPTETQEEALETTNFVLSNKDKFHSVGATTFTLNSHSKVAQQPQLYGVSNIICGDKENLALWYDYEVETGLSQMEAMDILKAFFRTLDLEYPLWRRLSREDQFHYLRHFGIEYFNDPTLLIALGDRLIDIPDINWQSVQPCLQDGILFRKFCFDLVDIEEEIVKDDAVSLERERKTTYVVFNLFKDNLFSINRIAYDILILCNGNLTVAEICQKLLQRASSFTALTEESAIVFLEKMIKRKIISV